MKPVRRPGRPAASSRAAVETTAVQLFLDRGFDKTTILDIASASGISKTSFFRYFDSKSEIVWGVFEAHLERLDRALRSRPEDEPVMTSVLRAIVETFSDDIDVEGVWLRRFRLQDAAEQRATQAVHWQRWARVVTDFIRDRSGAAPDDVTPDAVGAAVQASLLAFIRTRDVELDQDPEAVLASYESAVAELLRQMQGWIDHRGARRRG